MNKIVYPEKTEWHNLIKRPIVESQGLANRVSEIFIDIKNAGDSAVHKYAAIFDKGKVEEFKVSTESIQAAGSFISEELKAAIHLAKDNISKFHSVQLEESKEIETTKGVVCWRESRAIERIGIYIPGGSAPLFSTVLMLGVPAMLAGCQEIVLCTPPDVNGEINPAILYTASIVGITSIYCVGGIQAIAGMTFGTETIPKVDKIFGPGNQYVTAAKQMASNWGVAIDMPAGPSEVLIIADKSCNPAYVAADLLSQAEHGGDSQVILLSKDESVIDETMQEVKRQVKDLPRKDLALEALEYSKAILLKSITSCFEFSNLYAPEHLILAVANARKLIPEISSAGSVFLGNYSCESAGDYASGTNHTLPTNGNARSYSGVSMDSFVKKISFQEISKEGLRNLGPSIELMAEAEHLFAHKNAVSIRLKNSN